MLWRFSEKTSLFSPNARKPDQKMFVMGQFSRSDCFDNSNTTFNTKKHNIISGLLMPLKYYANLKSQRQI